GDMRAMYDQAMLVAEPPKMERVTDVQIPLEGRTIAGRLYVPEGAGDNPPLVVYFHGGGWVIGTLDTHDGTCRALARASAVAVLSVDYRLAPEHRYPAAPLDCFDATLWASKNGAALGVDASRIAVAGDSAGGNLAAVVAVMARDQGLALRHQLLIYPVTDCDFSFPSYAENGGGDYFLSTETMNWFWLHYLGGCSKSDAPLATVLRTEDLEGLAPATVITAQYDPLRDEGMAYAEKLKAAGNSVDAAIAPGMIHGFFSMFEAVPDAGAWIERGGANLAGGLA
ncbi:MAG: chloramphenicol hydrolase, partial [Pseudomonadota bacterium]